MLKIRKAGRLVLTPRFLRAAAIHRVAAAVEHLDVLRHTGPATVIDVGANKGQFSLAARATLPNAGIIAFEPLPEDAARYAAVLRGDDKVVLHRLALANRNGEAEFFVTDRSDSSSLLKPGAGEAAAFSVREAGTIRVSVRRISDVLALAGLPRPILLKIDVQGAELDVLKGCEELEAVDFIYVELSYVELYDGAPLFDDVAAYLATRGFAIRGVFNQVATREFGPTQADVLFARAASERSP